MSPYKRGSEWCTDFKFEGKRYRVRTEALTKYDAIAVEREMRSLMQKQKFGMAEKDMDLGKLVEVYLAYKSNGFAKTTFVRDRQVLTRFLSTLKVKTAKGITSGVIDDYARVRSSDAADGVTIQTVNLEITSLKAMLNWAVDRKYIDCSLIKGYKRIRGANAKTVQPLTEDQIELLLRKLTKRLRPVVALFLATGIRLKELIYMKWGWWIW